MDLLHEAIYEGRPVGRRIATAAMDFLRAQQGASSYLNVLQSMVDTIVARNGKRRPMPIISCDDAEYTEKLYARRASRVLRRKIGQPNFERMLPMMMRDAVVRGDGFVQAFRDGGDVGIERFPRSELVFDDGEARNGMPRTMARVKLVDRDILIARYPKAKDRILALSPAPRDYWTSYDYDMPMDLDQVEVGYGWRLPTSRDADNGRMVVCIRDGGLPLEEDSWCRPRFPFARVQWTPSMRGYYGIGLIQQLAGSQHKVNELWRDHQEALYWGSALKIFQQRQANVDKNHMRARHPAIIETDGPVPTYIAPDPASRQAMDSLRWLIQQMYEISGISQAAAASKNPLGPNASGKALDTMYDIESDRFSQFETQYAMARVDVGMIILDEAKEMAEDQRDGKLPTRKDEDGESHPIDLAPWIDQIEWDRFDFDGGAYHLAMEPINFLPESRAGKLDALGDLGKIPGLLTNPMQTASLFDEPDLQRSFRHLLGPYRMLEKVMEMLGDESVPISECVPTPQMDPMLAEQMALGELGNAYSEGAGDALQGRYRWFLTMLEGLKEMAAPPSAPPPDQGGPIPSMPGPAPGAPPGMPMGGMQTPNQLAPLIGPMGGIDGTISDPMGGATSMMAAGMPVTGMQ